jgi:hypothetical protein
MATKRPPPAEAARPKPELKASVKPDYTLHLAQDWYVNTIPPKNTFKVSERSTVLFASYLYTYSFLSNRELLSPKFSANLVVVSVLKSIAFMISKVVITTNAF